MTNRRMMRHTLGLAGAVAAAFVMIPALADTLTRTGDSNASSVAAIRSGDGTRATPQTDDPAAFIGAALARGEKEIRVPKGAYDVGPGEVASVYLEGVRDVTIDFQRGELRGRTRSALITLRDCTGVTVRNVTLDYPFNLPFTQGLIEKVGPDGEWDVRIAQGYPDPADGRWGWPVQAYDAKTGDLVNPMRYLDGIKVTRTAPGRWRVTGGKDRRGKAGDIAVWSLLCETRNDTHSAATRAHAVYLLNCGGCRMENVTVHSTPGSNGFRELFGEGGNAYVSCHVVPRPPETDPVRREVQRFRSGNHDAFNSRGVRKGPTLKGCTARNHCDDDLNIHGAYQYIASAAGATVRAFVKDMYAETLRVGDPVQFVTADGYAPDALLRIVALKPATPTAAEQEQVKKGLVGQVVRTCNTMLEVTFERADPVLKPGTLFVSMNAAGSGFRVENCRFGPNRARGFISNASYGDVVGCTFDRTESYGVLSRPSYQWMEGGASRNVRFKDCTFIDCGVFYGVHREMLTTNECHRNVVFAGCRFKGPRGRLEVQCCTGLALDANTFDLPEEKAVVLRKVGDAMTRRVAYGTHPRQYFVFLRPDGFQGKLPLTVMIHGGGWRNGHAVDHGVYPLLERARREGFALAALQYRFVSDAAANGVYPPVKAVYDDCFAAIRHLKDQAAAFGIDPDRITLVGGSAGACTALQLVLKDSNPLGIAEVCPRIAQTTLDPQLVRTWLPNLQYGAQAFGLSWPEFVRRRDELKPLIDAWSPLALLEKADPKRLPPIRLAYDHAYPGGVYKGSGRDDSVHDAAFGYPFLSACRRLGVKCEMTVAGKPVQ